MRAAGGLLDRYVLRRYVSAYGLCLAGFLMLFLVVDFSMRIDKFLEGAATVEAAGLSLWPLIGEYYATKLVWISTFVGPFITLFAAIAALISLGRNNEITPMIAAGRSHHRALAPIYVFAVLAAAALAVLEADVAPFAMKRNVAIWNTLHPKEHGDTPPHLRDVKTGNILSAQQWLPLQQRLVDVHAPSYRDESGKLPRGRLDASALIFRRNRATREIGWFAVDGTLTPAADGKGGALPAVMRLAPDKPIAFKMTPAEVTLVTASAEPGLTNAELDDLVGKHPERFDLLMQMLTRLTRPASSLVLLLLGLPFVLRPGQRTIAAGLGVALGTCAVYMAVDFFFQQLGNRGEIQPLVAAWLATALFGSIALSRLDRMAG
jgi:lipopolysaccharide export system permease protein